MPIVEPSGYRAPLLLREGHVHTLFNHFARQSLPNGCQRERLVTPDEDFLDLDTSRVTLSAGVSRVAILSHGMEGSSDRTYMRYMMEALNRNGWDAVAWNFRGCSGEMNRQLRTYHSGETGDLQQVITHVASRGYKQIALIGFSLGGNVTLKYVGEQGPDIDPRIVAAVTFSVPTDLGSAAVNLSRLSNRLYLYRFIRLLRRKIIAKSRLFPDQVNPIGSHDLMTFPQFDDRYTAPIHGFKSAEQYYRQSSSQAYLSRIRIPTLLVNSADDPFLSRDCYPYAAARDDPYFFLEVPSHGGHVGFVAFNPQGEYWSETRAVQFLQQAVPGNHPLKQEISQAGTRVGR